ncbi:nucleoporin Ndc1 [Drosophila ficusphila]|uniref:nucleoporin Ndc1 n=1 Tax=Drosophila ficusphila TaxID=30025 RepID=UPI0007E8B223|nr:nucleoporin Ndc1 [Drosophila ficusphila]
MVEEVETITGFAPRYFVSLPRKIKKLLVYRFLFATLLCSWLDYQLLAIFLCINLFEVRRPLDSLNDILNWTLFSVYTATVMLLIRLSIVLYGLILCHVHYAIPQCYPNRMARIVSEFPQHFCLLSSILSITTASSWLYASFVEFIDKNYLLGGSWYYLMTFGCFIGISYFHKHHGRCLTRFSLPIVYLDMKECLLRMWLCQLKSSGKQAIVPTLLFALIYWPSMGYWESTVFDGLATGVQVIITQPTRLFQGWLLSTLTLAKLCLVREVYGLIMQRKLSLVNDSRRLHEFLNPNLFTLILERWKNFTCIMRMKPMASNKPGNNFCLPVSMALDTPEIYGFQLLAARDFYVAMSGSLCSELYKIKCSTINRKWTELRDVILGSANEFLAGMDSCLESTPRIKISHLLKTKAPQKPGLRFLVKPPTRQLPLRCRGHPNCQVLEQTWCFCNLQQYFLKRVFYYWNRIWSRMPVVLQWYCFLHDPVPLAKLNHVLKCAEPLVWSLQGLVCICVRSAKEDTFGYIQSDLESILKCLLNVQEKLISAEEMQMRELGKLCSSHDLLLKAINRCLYKMLFVFGPYVDFLLYDKHLNEKVKSRMDLLP